MSTNETNQYTLVQWTSISLVHRAIGTDNSNSGTTLCGINYYDIPERVTVGTNKGADLSAFKYPVPCPKCEKLAG